MAVFLLPAELYIAHRPAAHSVKSLVVPRATRPYGVAHEAAVVKGRGFVRHYIGPA